MSLQINLDDKKEVILLLDLLKGRLKDVKMEIAMKEQEIRIINSKITQLSRLLNETNSSFKSEDNYSEKWQWQKKIAFAISLAGKPLTASEIVDSVLNYEPTLDRKRALSSVSGTLSTKSGDAYENDKQFIRGISESGEYSYELREKEIDQLTVNLKSEIDSLYSDLPF